MADINGDNYAKGYVNVPAELGNVGEVGGVIKVLFDKKTITTAAENDVFYVGKLPANARILSVNHVGCGTAPTFSVAVGALLTAETVLTVTVGASPSNAALIAWVTYTID